MSNVIPRKYDGIPLKIDGMPIRTDDPNCCCGNPCCTCSTIDLLFSLGLQLQVKITGAITGTCRMGIDEGSDSIVCAGWTLDTSTLFCDPDIVESCALNLQTSHFYCPKDTEINQYQFESQLANLGCNFSSSPSDPTPLFGATKVAKYPTEISCDPNYDPLNDTPTDTWPFYAKYVFPLEDTFPNGCSTCSDTQIIFEVSVYNAPGGFRSMPNTYVGPGTVIKQELAKFGIVADKGCACKDLARKMDADGPDKVETNIDDYVNKMRESIKSWKGKIPVPTPPDFVIRQLILHAVKRSRKFNGK